MTADLSRIATLAALTSEGLGGRASIDLRGVSLEAAEAEYGRRLRSLSSYDFWRMGEADYRPEIGLRLPQRRAIAFAQAYLAIRAQPEEAGRAEAALVKMPTGTGKTAVIAAIACASPSPMRTLVLTPRKALVRQMARDLATRFWSKLGAAYTADGLQENLPKAELERLDAELRGTRSPIRILNADQYAAIWDGRDGDRQIWVGTFNALHRVLAIAPPPHREFYGREAQAAAASLSTLETENAADSTDAFRELLRSVDLVIVDEGHHEPAYSWAQAVRALNKPTVVFTATPYRNDYKFFQVTGRFVFSLSWKESVDRKLIRNVEVEDPVRTGSGPTDHPGPYDARRFVGEFGETVRRLPAGKKAIVHAASFATLKAVQRAFFETMGEKTVLIHDRVVGKEKDDPPDLAKRSSAMREVLRGLRFAEVYQVPDFEDANPPRVWLHQYKLLEGVDDPRFVEIWLYDAFGTARQLVQQIGRAIRRPDVDDPTGETAVVRGGSQLLDVYRGAPTVATTTERRWKAYLEFEAYVEESPDRAFTAETQLLPLLKRSSPAVQYVAGEFRGAHWLDEKPSMVAFVLPRRATVCRAVSDGPATEIPDGFLDELQSKALEAMQLEERFDIEDVAAPASGSDFDDVRMVQYLKWQNSPLLRSHQIPEWTLGVLIIVRAGEYVFLMDTGGNCLDHASVGLAPPDPIELKRLFAEAKPGETSRVRIVETTARGLDVSELGLRSISIRRHALDVGYFDLAEASQTPTSIEGYSPLGDRTSRRRLSLARATVADASNGNVPVKDYVEWCRNVAAVMADRTLRPHAYFNRFATEVPPLAEEEGVPRSILLDVVDLIPEPGSLQDRGWDRPALERLLEADTCRTVKAETNDDGVVVRYWFDFDGHRVDISYVHRATIPPYGRYSLHSEDLNSSVTDGPGDSELSDEADAALETSAFGRKLSPSLTRLMNGQQAFQVITSSDGVVYSHGHFYRPELDRSLLMILEGDAAAAAASSEKGDTRVTDVADWGSRTLFGLVENWAKRDPTTLRPDSLAWNVARSDTLVCDDSTNETADFYAVDHVSRKVFVIHAKSGKSKKPTASARNLQEVARQALTSLALTGSARQSFPYPKDWDSDWSVKLQDAGNAEVSRPRLWKRTAGGISEAHGSLRAALANPAFTTEIVILASGLLSAKSAENAFKNKSLPNLQFLYYLATVRSAFDRAGVRLRIVCNP